MSLGPPFDHSGEKTRLILGGVACVALMFIIGIALLLADRSLGSYITVRLLVTQPGALHTGARVLAGGEQIGEVVAIRGQKASRAGLSATPLLSNTSDKSPSVEVELRLLSEYAERVYQNSTFLPINPTLLTEAQLEIGPPENGAAPGLPIAQLGPQERLRGTDPADLDQLLRRVYLSVELALLQARDLSPQWTELQAALGGLSQHLSQSVDMAALVRTQVQLVAALHGIEQLAQKVDSAGVQSTATELQALAKAALPLLRTVAQLQKQAGQLQERASELQAAFGPQQQRQLKAVMQQLQASLQAGQRLQGDVLFLLRQVDTGQGTLGGVLNDMQIFDELKDSARILKTESWRLILKPRRGSEAKPK